MKAEIGELIKSLQDLKIKMEQMELFKGVVLVNLQNCWKTRKSNGGYK